MPSLKQRGGASCITRLTEAAQVTGSALLRKHDKRVGFWSSRSRGRAGRHYPGDEPGAEPPLGLEGLHVGDELPRVPVVQKIVQPHSPAREQATGDRFDRVAIDRLVVRLFFFKYFIFYIKYWIFYINFP